MKALFIPNHLLKLFACCLLGLMTGCDQFVGLGSSPDQAFMKFYGGAKDQITAQVLPALDGGYILLGTSTSHNFQGDQNLYVVKTDSAGNEVWSRAYGRLDWEETGSAIVYDLTQNGYYLCGTSIDSLGNADPYLLHIGLSGNVIWESRWETAPGLADTLYQTGMDIQTTRDGHILFAGEVRPIRLGDERLDAAELNNRLDTYLMKLDPSGNEANNWPQLRQWGFPKADEVQRISELPTGEIAVLGTTFHSDAGQAGSNLLFYTTNAEGVPNAAKSIGGMEAELASSFQAHADGSFTLIGSQVSSAEASSVYLAKLDAEQRLMPGDNPQTLAQENALEQGISVQTLRDGTGLVVSGTAGVSPNRQFFIRTLDANGQTIAQNEFGQVGDALAANVIEVADGFVLAGTVTFGSNRMMCLIKVDQNLSLIPE